jgi:hypothetical protein
MLANHQHPFRVNLPFKAAVESDGAFEVNDSFESNAFAQNGEAFAVSLVVAPCLCVPHGDGPFPIELCTGMPFRETVRMSNPRAF